MKEYPEPGKEKRELFLGRTQPPHKGHYQIIKKMKKPIVLIVKGKASSADKEKNPFSANYQLKLFKMMFPSLDVSIAPNGFLPGILGFYRKKGIEITKVYAGADRISGYKEAVDKANSNMEDKYHYGVTFVETPRVTSATKVRESIKNNDFDEFKQLMPKELHGEFETMQKIMSGELNEEYSSFNEYLHMIDESDG